jgi:hypothetical protein
MYRVEIRRHMHPTELKHPKAEKQEVRDETSMEYRMQALLDDLTVLDGGEASGPPKQIPTRKQQKYQTNLKFEQQLSAAAIAYAAAKGAKMSKMETEKRRLKARLAVEAMLKRYRQHVDHKRNVLLQEMGINLDDPHADEPGTPEVSVHDSIRRDAMGQSMMFDAGKDQFEATQSLVQRAMDRVKRVTDRLEKSEKELAAKLDWEAHGREHEAKAKQKALKRAYFG